MANSQQTSETEKDRASKRGDAKDKPATANGANLTHVDESATDAVKSAYLDKKSGRRE